MKTLADFGVKTGDKIKDKFFTTHKDDCIFYVITGAEVKECVDLGISYYSVKADLHNKVGRHYWVEKNWGFPLGIDDSRSIDNTDRFEKISHI